MSKTLLFIETTHKREYLYMAKSLGYNIVVAENSFDNHDNVANYVIRVNIHNYDELVTKAVKFNEDVHIDGVLTVHEHAVEAVAIVANCLGLPGLSIAGAINCRNKYLSRMLLKKFNIHHPKFALISDFTEISDKIKDIGIPFIIKPLKYSGSSAVMKINSLEEMKNLESILISKRHGSSCKATMIDTLPDYWIIEEFLEGFEISVQAITWNGKTHVIAIHDKVVPMNGPEFAEEYILTPSPRINEELEKKIITATQIILERTGFDFGLSHVEFRIVNQNPILLEVNGRIGGGTTNDIVFYSTGVNLFASLIDIVLGQEPKINIPSRKCVAVKRIQLTQGMITKISGFEEAKITDGIVLTKQWMVEGETVKTATRDVGGAVLAVANTTAEALAIVEQAAEKIKFEIEDV